MDIQPTTNLTPPGNGLFTSPASAAPAASAALSAPSAHAAVASAEPTPAQLAEAVKSINKTMESLAPGLEFSIDKDTHFSVVKVVDTQTNQVIRQFPSQEVLDIARALDQVRGLLIKEKV